MYLDQYANFEFFTVPGIQKTWGRYDIFKILIQFPIKTSKESRISSQQLELQYFRLNALKLVYTHLFFKHPIYAQSCCG